EVALDHVKRLGLFHQTDRQPALHAEARVGPVRRHSQPVILLLLGENEPDERKQLEIALSLRQAAGTHEVRFRQRRGAKDPPALEIRRLDAEATNDAGDAHLDFPARQHRCQELAGQESLLGRRQAIEGLLEMLRFGHGWCRKEKPGPAASSKSYGLLRATGQILSL